MSIASLRPDSNAERKEGRRETWFHLVRSFTILVSMMFGSEFLTHSLARVRLPAPGVYAPTRHARLPAHQQYKRASVAGASIYLFTRVYIYQNTGMQGQG